MKQEKQGFIVPHGGKLVSRIMAPARAAELRNGGLPGPSWVLNPRQLCDLELLANGGFSPLTGFLSRSDYESVLSRMRLTDGELWPIPVCLDLPEKLGETLETGSRLTLLDPAGKPLGLLHVRDAWRPDRVAEALAIYGTESREHPGVEYLLAKTNPCYVGGDLEVFGLPAHEDFPELRRTPAQLREEFEALNWKRVVAFQTRNPLHRAHQELTLRAAREAEAHLLIHPVVGQTKPGDVDHITRVRCYKAALAAYPPDVGKLALLPLAMRMAGPREALWHAIIRKNHGATHLIVGRDHAGPGRNSAGAWFYDPYAAQDLLRANEKELGIEMVEFRMMVYVKDLKVYVPENEVPAGMETLNISGTELRERLQAGQDIPEWFTFPEVTKILRESPLAGGT